MIGVQPQGCVDTLGLRQAGQLGTMRSAKLRICGSWDLASAILPASISPMPAWAAIFTNAAGSGTALSASPAEAADEMPASARNNRLRETVIKIRSFV